MYICTYRRTDDKLRFHSSGITSAFNKLDTRHIYTPLRSTELHAAH